MTSTLTILKRSTFDRLTQLAGEAGLTASRKTLACASELVEYFSNWRKFKISTHRTEWIYQPIRRLVEDLIAFGKYLISKGLDLLLNLGILERRQNPGNGQDRTYQYRLNPKVFEAETGNPQEQADEQEPSVAGIKTGNPENKISPPKSDFGEYQNNKQNIQSQEIAPTGGRIF